jgi:hypothetical protein
MARIVSGSLSTALCEAPRQSIASSALGAVGALMKSQTFTLLDGCIARSLE